MTTPRYFVPKEHMLPMECDDCKSYNPEGKNNYLCAVRGRCPGLENREDKKLEVYFLLHSIKKDEEIRRKRETEHFQNLINRAQNGEL